MIAIDGEWGLDLRFRNSIKFPSHMTLGAIRDDSLIYEMGREIARECKRLGIHLNFTPIVYYNNDTLNPVINNRSFDTDKDKIAEKRIMFIKGMQDGGIIATAKHLSGYDNTDTDSNLILSEIKHDRNRLDSIELFMKMINDCYSQSEVYVKALLAGNDIFALTESVPETINEIKNAAEEGKISWKEIESRCRKVIASKLWVGLDSLEPIEVKNIDKDLNIPEAAVLNQQLIRSSLTVLRNADNIIPVKNLAKIRIASLGIGSKDLTNFQKMLANYTKIDHYYVDPASQEATNVLNKLQSYDLVITGIFNPDQGPCKNSGITSALQAVVNELINKNKTIITVFGNPFTLGKLPGIENSDGLILTYQNNTIAQEQAAQMIFGANGSYGRLPVQINDLFNPGSGIKTTAISRLRYTIPEEEGLDSKILENAIDSIAANGIEAGAFPGCEVLVARNGAIVFHKTYGYHTYENRNAVCKDDIFDFASVTKITGPLPVLMQLYDKGKIKLDDKLSNYWPDFRHSNKAGLTFREILAHQSGMTAWIPYWKSTKKENGKFKNRTFKTDSLKKYNIPVITDLYLHENYRKKMYKAIKKSSVSGEKKYLYSGLSFYLYPQIIKNLTGEDYETYLKENIYKPLGAYTLTYNSYLHFPLQQIVPTENDTFFRHKQIHGYVHDEGAAMMGGVSGNAGLFGTANDLAKLMQMYLQMGFFGGEEFISESTMKEFTRYQYPENDNRRGLGFDKPKIRNYELPDNEIYPAKSASPLSFGHSGFTGMFTWVDPTQNLLYIFFSNRVYPTRENGKIYELNIRISIQEAIYSALIKSPPTW